MIIHGARNPLLRKVIGCTMAGPAYLSLGEQARESFECVTGLPCRLFKTRHDENYRDKFDLHSNFTDDETVIFFDADTRWVRPFNPLLVTEDFGMVLDAGVDDEQAFPIHDCRNLDMPPEHYGNSGVMIFNAAHRHVWDECHRLFGRVVVQDFGEQSVINLALHRLGVKRDFLPAEWNYAPIRDVTGRPQAINREPYVIHAMGYKQTQTGKRLTDKEAVLNLYEGKYMLCAP